MDSCSTLPSCEGSSTTSDQTASNAKMKDIFLSQTQKREAKEKDPAGDILLTVLANVLFPTQIMFVLQHYC